MKILLDMRERKKHEDINAADALLLLLISPPFPPPTPPPPTNDPPSPPVPPMCPTVGDDAPEVTWPSSLPGLLPPSPLCSSAWFSPVIYNNIYYLYLLYLTLLYL